MLEVGGGGAGPSYGLFPFGMIDDGFGHAPWTTWKLRPGEPFPHREEWNDVSILEVGAPSPDDFDEHEAYEVAYDDWRASDAAHERQNVYWEAVGTRRGCIPLCHHGCALRDWLVVSGPEAGTVWHDASADTMGIAPINEAKRSNGGPTPAPFAGVGMPSRSGATHVIAGADGARTTFAEWYLRWLEGALASLRTGPEG